MIKWFTFENELVQGPYSTDEIKLSKKQAQLSDSALIWGHVLSGWVNYESWSEKIENGSTLAQVHDLRSTREWYIGNKGDSIGPFSRRELTSELLKFDDFSSILLWTTGMKQWSSLFDFHDLLDELGINLRRHPRAEVDGTVNVITSEGRILKGQLRSISEGGVGCSDITGIKVNSEVLLEIDSPQFKRIIKVRAEVRYVSDSGFIGTKFAQINPEFLSEIIYYIKNNASKKIPYNQKSAA